MHELVEHLTKPVMWASSIQFAMEKLGVTEFVQISPVSQLLRLIKRDYNVQWKERSIAHLATVISY